MREIVHEKQRREQAACIRMTIRGLDGIESDLCVLCRTCHEVFERNGRLVDWREDAA